MQRPVDLQAPRSTLKTEWTSRVVCGRNTYSVDEVTGVKTSDFENLLNEAFADLRDNGWHTSMVQPFQDGFIVFANRAAVSGNRGFFMPGEPEQEVTVLYTYLDEMGVQASLTFATLQEGLRVAAADFRQGHREPVSLHVSSWTSYNRSELWRLTTQAGK